MNGIKLTKNQKVILSIIQRLKNKSEGRKKIMKLMFLMEHYNLERNNLEKEGFLGNEFIIYHYGVFSFEVMDDYLKLNGRGIIKERPLKVLKNGVELDEMTLKRLKSILEKFGQKSGFELEGETLEMLGISKETKKKFFTKKISEII